MATATRTRKPRTTKAPVVSTEVESVEPVIEGTIHEGDLPTAEPTAEPGPASTEARIAALKAAWTKGTEDESNALFNLGVARVIKARVAYMAGALGSKSGAPNNKAAMRILDLPQNTIRPYFLAGVALAEAGWDGHITAPTQAEIDLVSPIIAKASKGAPKADAPKGESAPKGDAEGDDDEAPAKGGRVSDPDSPVIMADVINAVEALDNVVAAFTRECGFPGNVAENLQTVLAEIAARIEAHRVDGGDV